MKLGKCGERYAIIGLLLTFVWLSSSSSGVTQGVWKTYTAKREIRDVTVHGGVVWAATSGGMFSLILSDSSFQEFTTSEGLQTNDLSAVTIDDHGSLWAGATNGLLHAHTLSTRQWRYVTDIARDNAPQKRINWLRAWGDTLFVASDIGLSEYLIDRNEFRYTARSFGGALQIVGNATGVALYGDSIWVGTRSGVAAAPRSHPNLSAPTSWRVWQTGLPSNDVSSLAVFRGSLYAATSQGLSRYGGGSWTTVGSTSGMNLLEVVVQGDQMYVITATDLAMIDSNENLSTVRPGFPPLSALRVEGTQIVVGSQRNGVYVERNSVWQSMFPKGPPTNRITGVSIDERGVLWAGTGSAGGEGFMSFDGTQWISYTAQDNPILRGNEYYKANVGKDNVKWLSSWGYGVALVDARGQIEKVFSTTNGLPATVCPGCPPDFVVVTGVVTDLDGRAWICVRTGRGDTTFAIVAGDSIVSYVAGPVPGGTPIFSDPVIDGFGTIWLTSRESNTGLHFYNDRGFPGADPSRWGRITQANGLTSDGVFALAVDQSGQIWVGTNAGINIILNPYSLRPPLASYVPLREQHINALAVDALNSKWVATNQGIFLLSPDGTSILAYYSVENTGGKLIDNEIKSIAIDGRSGTVYFGSDKGLSSLTTSAVTPARSFDELIVSPNPFYIPSTSSVTIDGLVMNSSLKILSIDGALIKDIKTPGGRVGFWDGTDVQGNYVASGVYLIVAHAENGNQVASGKVAVLRR